METSATSDGGPHLLVVDDDVRLAQGLCRNLELEGFRTTAVHCGEAALERLRGAGTGVDLVILDVMMPGMDGLEVCRRLRDSGSQVPVLFLTARASDADRVLGLRLGADDYLVKPFVVEELVLRVQGILRRTAGPRAPSPIPDSLRVGRHHVDLAAMKASTADGPVDLTEREAALLRYLAENEGRVISRGELLERVWGYASDTATRTLDTFVHRLRRYFEDDPGQPRHLHTVRGVGYRFTLEPEG